MLYSGGTNNASSKALRPEATKSVHLNRDIKASSLRNSLIPQSGCGKLASCSASHLRNKEILGTEIRKVAISCTMLESFLGF